MGSGPSSTVTYDKSIKATLKAKVNSVLAFQKGKQLRQLLNAPPHDEDKAPEETVGPIKENSRKVLLEFVETMKRETAEDWLTLTKGKNSSASHESSDLVDSEAFLQWKADREKMIHKEEHGDWSCRVCNDFALFAGYKCRVCGRIYHNFCLVSSGKYSERDLEMVERLACATKGWTCYWCEDITSLLSPEEMQDLFEILDLCDIDKDHCVSLTEYLAYQQKKYLNRHGSVMPFELECRFRSSFTEMDIGGTGSLEWREFLKYEALETLKQKDKDVLTSYLSKHEVGKAKKLFERFDEDNNGTIDRREARKIYTNWFQSAADPFDLTEESLDNCFFALSQEDKHTVLESADDDNDGDISWIEFLRCQAYYIILSRINRACAIKDNRYDRLDQ